MLSLCARRASRQCHHVQLVVVHSRSASSLIDLAPLHKRTLGFSKFAHKVTNDPTFDFVSLLRGTTDPGDPAIADALFQHRIPQSEWLKWSPVLYSPSFECALDLIRQKHVENRTPPWVILALACHKVRSPSDAESLLYDLTLPLTSLQPSLPPPVRVHSPPLFILTAHSLAHFALLALLRPLTSRLLEFPSHEISHNAFYFNMFLQAVSNSPRSKEVSTVVISILEEMQRRNVALWADTERVLIRKNFVMAKLAAHLRKRGTPQNDTGAEKRHKTHLEAWLKAYGSLADVQQSEHYLNAIREYSLKNGLTPPYPSDATPTPKDEHNTRVQGSAQNANNDYLRALRNDQQSAFRYFHHLLTLDVAKPDRPPPTASTTSPSTPSKGKSKMHIDIYDWTTALHAGACDPSLSTNDFLNLFKLGKSNLNSYRPTSVTYTVVMRGLMRKGAFEEALGLWDEFVTDVVRVRAHEEQHESKNAVMQIDRHALCTGIDVLVQNGRAAQALYLLEEAIKIETAKATAAASPTESPEITSSLTSDSSLTLAPKAYSYLTDVPIFHLIRALLNTRRPDAAFYIWAHLTPLYFVKPTDQMLHLFLKAALQASHIDAESVKGSVSWYLAGTKIFSKNVVAPMPTPDISTLATENRESESGDETSTDSDTRRTTATSASHNPQSRKSLLSGLRALLESSPSVVGIWAGRRATAVARSIFRGMILGNWPALNKSTAKGKSSLSVWPELSRMFGSSTLTLPTGPTPLGIERPKPAKRDKNGDLLGPPLPTVYPSEGTFFTYISLLGLSARAEEIPEALVWMRALGIIPRTRTLSVALVFWAEVGLRGPLFEDGWIGAMDWWRKKDPSASEPESESKSGPGSDALDSDAPDSDSESGSGSGSKGDAPRTEYGALRAWMLDWVGEQWAPTEADIEAAIVQVAMMRDTGFKNRGGGL